MKRVNQILSVLMGMIFIVSSTGVLIYKTHCTCTGNEKVGIYIKPESCENNFQVLHSLDQSVNETEANENCCHECTPESHDCGCSVPEITFFKLMNEISNHEVTYVYPPVLKIEEIIFTELINFTEASDSVETADFYSNPPPKITSSKSFLIEVHQLKIPFIA